jgi:hypothetical protein
MEANLAIWSRWIDAGFKPSDQCWNTMLEVWAEFMVAAKVGQDPEWHAKIIDLYRRAHQEAA